MIQTGLALVGIQINDGLDASAAVAAETLFDATDDALLVLGKAEWIVSASEAAPKLGEKIKNFKCSCGTLNKAGECEPTDGPTNPLYRLKERAKMMFKKGKEDGGDDDSDDEFIDRLFGQYDDDEFSDARDGTENGGEVVDDEVYHDAMEKSPETFL